MKWINEPIKGTGYSEPMFALTPQEAGIIAEALEPAFKSLKKKYERLEDLRQIGEMTEKQSDKWIVLQEKIETIEQFIKIGW